MAHSKDKNFVPIDANHVSVEFAERVSKMFENSLDGPFEEEQEITTNLLSKAALDVNHPSSVSLRSRKRPNLRIIPAYSSPETENIITPVSKIPNYFSALSVMMDPNRDRVSIQLESSLKTKIINLAMENETSAAGVMNSVLRDAFPESWESKENYFNLKREPLRIEDKAYFKYDWNTKFAQRQINSAKNAAKSRINFRLPSDLKEFLLKKANEYTCLLTFNQLIETTLELALDDEDDLHLLYNANNEPT